MRIAAIADLHGFLPDTPECDVLIVAGDVCPVIDHGIDRQAAWVLGPLSEWLEIQPAKEVIVIAGNHDFIFEKGYRGDEMPCHYLENSGIQIGGVEFWGSPLSGQFYDWAFMAHENELVQIWNGIPEGVQVLITHGPAFGAGDRTLGGVDAGSPSLRERILHLRPKLHITGHIHEAAGISQILHSDGGIIVGNASCVNANYELVHKPLLFDLTDDGIAVVT